MKNVTILVQGDITQEVYNFYTETYPNFPLVFSVWSDSEFEDLYIPNNLTLIKQKQPEYKGPRNSNLQFTSTLAGLDLVKTKYVIKARGDEYYSNLQNLISLVEKEPNKIHCSPIFFRKHDFMNYYTSNHLMIGLTNEMRFMFSSAKYGLDNKLLTFNDNGIDELYRHHEVLLTRAYLMAKEGDLFYSTSGSDLIKKYFNIFSLENLKPYKVISNLNGKVWYSNYEPERNFSISNIDDV